MPQSCPEPQPDWLVRRIEQVRPDIAACHISEAPEGEVAGHVRPEPAALGEFVIFEARP